jgi:L-rhamnonate dehydratase
MMLGAGSRLTTVNDTITLRDGHPCHLALATGPLRHLARTLRETLGDDYDIMLDCWQSFDPTYAVELADRIAEFRPRWLEECVMPDRIDSYRRIEERTQIPLSGAEHEYTRWGFRRFVDIDALDVLQPEIY